MTTATARIAVENTLTSDGTELPVDLNFKSMEDFKPEMVAGKVPDDLSRIHCHLPASAHTLKYEIETTLLRYEPRLKAIDLTIEETEPGILLRFTMSCYLRQAGLVRFGTHFTPDGKTRPKLLKADRDRK